MVGVALAMALPVGLAAVAGPAAAAPGHPTDVHPASVHLAYHATVDGVPANGGAAIVRATPGRLGAAEAAVRRAGGSVTRRMSSLDSLAVTLPAGAAEHLASDPDVHSI